MGDGFFVDLEPSLRALHAEAGSGVVDVEEEVGCSSLPGEAAQAAAAGDSPSSTSGNSVAGGQSTARGELGVRAEVSVIDGADGGERAVVSGWKRRPRVGKAPPERPLNSARVTALERTLREFPARTSGEVIVPEVGVSFDSIGEAYDFYILYSWERGFGVRYGKSRLNMDRVKCMQEIVSGCREGLEEQTRNQRDACALLSSGCCGQRTMGGTFASTEMYTAMHYVDELVPGEVYDAIHFDSESREKWCKVKYTITVSDGYYTCECGMYEHMGMLCCHVLKVLSHLRLKEIPSAHVLKRWTVDARDVLPMHLVQYQKDQGLVTSFSFRHSQLYLNCMEVVRLGDVNVDACTTAMKTILVLVPKLKMVAVECDGLGLEERLNAKRARVGGQATQLVGQNIHRDNVGSDAISLDAALLAPSKNRSGGRPTNSRDKPPYETTSKRTRFCTICRLPRHKSTTCPDCPPGAAKPRKEAKCSNCGLPGHRKTSCVGKAPVV